MDFDPAQSVGYSCFLFMTTQRDALSLLRQKQSAD